MSYEAIEEIKTLLAHLKETAEKQKESSDALMARFDAHEERVSSQLIDLANAQVHMETRLRDPPPLTDPHRSRTTHGDQCFILSGRQGDPTHLQTPETVANVGGTRLMNLSTSNTGVGNFQNILSVDHPLPPQTIHRVSENGDHPNDGITVRTPGIFAQQNTSGYEDLRRSIEKTRADLLVVTSKIHRIVSEAPEIDRVIAETERTPFTRRIADAHIRETRKLKLPVYAGDGDPKAHMIAFRIGVARAHFNDEEKDVGYCKLFAEHLTGPALEWFSKLKSESIDDFTQLSTAFIKHYSIFMERGTFDGDLWTVTQDADEPLRAFIERFKEVKAKISGVSESTAVAALKHGLWHESPFRFDLTIHKPETIEDALHRSTNWIIAEEERDSLGKKFKKDEAIYGESSIRKKLRKEEDEDF